jgi:hypothetical protein
VLILLVEDVPIAEVQPERVCVRLSRELRAAAPRAGRVAVFIVSMGALGGREPLSGAVPPMPHGPNGYFKLLGYGLVGEALPLELETAFDERVIADEGQYRPAERACEERRESLTRNDE